MQHAIACPHVPCNATGIHFAQFFSFYENEICVALSHTRACVQFIHFKCKRNCDESDDDDIVMLYIWIDMLCAVCSLLIDTSFHIERFHQNVKCNTIFNIAKVV